MKNQTHRQKWRFFNGETMPPQNNTDVMQLFVIMAASIFGPSMSQIIGPYILIAFAAATGAGWSLGRRDPNGKISALFYFVRVVFTAILLTVAIAKIMASFIPPVEADFLVAPVALIIGLIGDDWKHVGVWFITAVKRFINSWIDRR